MPIKIKWLKDGQPLDNSLGGTISTADFTSFLSFARVSRVHNGNYTCLAENPAASSSYSTPMIVQGEYSLHVQSLSDEWKSLLLRAA